MKYNNILHAWLGMPPHPLLCAKFHFISYILSIFDLLQLQDFSDDFATDCYASTPGMQIHHIKAIILL